jgi:ketosteroid isomerase-like protein
MSRENVSCVEVAFRAFERDGLEGFMSHWTDDADHRAIKGALDDRGPMHGKDEVGAYIEDWLDTFDDVATEILELIDAGDDKVVAVLKAGGKAKLSGISS